MEAWDKLLIHRRSDTLGLLEFQRTYNKHWLIERHGHRPPTAIRREQTVNIQQAALAQFAVSKLWTGTQEIYLRQARDCSRITT